MKRAEAGIPGPLSEDQIRKGLANLAEVLQTDIATSATLIRAILKDAKLDVKTDENGKEYVDYSAVLRALALLSFFSDQGSDSLTWWRWGELNPRPRSLGDSFLHA